MAIFNSYVKLPEGNGINGPVMWSSMFEGGYESDS
jgi:hypothetical protein